MYTTTYYSHHIATESSFRHTQEWVVPVGLALKGVFFLPEWTLKFDRYYSYLDIHGKSHRAMASGHSCIFQHFLPVHISTIPEKGGGITYVEPYSSLKVTDLSSVTMLLVTQVTSSGAAAAARRIPLVTRVTISRTQSKKNYLAINELFRIYAIYVLNISNNRI